MYTNPGPMGYSEKPAGISESSHSYLSYLPGIAHGSSVVVNKNTQ